MCFFFVSFVIAGCLFCSSAKSVSVSASRVCIYYHWVKQKRKSRRLLSISFFAAEFDVWFLLFGCFVIVCVCVWCRRPQWRPMHALQRRRRCSSSLCSWLSASFPVRHPSSYHTLYNTLMLPLAKKFKSSQLTTKKKRKEEKWEKKSKSLLVWFIHSAAAVQVTWGP